MFLAFLKKKNKWKEKKPLLSYPGLRYAHKKLNFACKKFFSENVCLHRKLDLRMKKILGRIFKITWKNVCVVFGNCMVSIFSKKIENQFFLSPVSSTVLKKPQKWFDFVSIVFRNFMKIVWQAFLPYNWCMELYDNDFCCMELYDKHFRCLEVNPGYYSKNQQDCPY